MSKYLKTMQLSGHTGSRKKDSKYTWMKSEGDEWGKIIVEN